MDILLYCYIAACKYTHRWVDCLKLLTH